MGLERGQVVEILAEEDGETKMRKIIEDVAEKQVCCGFEYKLWI